MHSCLINSIFCELFKSPPVIATRQLPESKARFQVSVEVAPLLLANAKTVSSPTLYPWYGQRLALVSADEGTQHPSSVQNQSMLFFSLGILHFKVTIPFHLLYCYFQSTGAPLPYCFPNSLPNIFPHKHHQQYTPLITATSLTFCYLRVSWYSKYSVKQNIQHHISKVYLTVSLDPLVLEWRCILQHIFTSQYASLHYSAIQFIHENVYILVYLSIYFVLCIDCDIRENI